MREVSGTIQHGVHHLRLEEGVDRLRLAHEFVKRDLQRRHVQVAANALVGLPQEARLAARQELLFDFLRDAADDLVRAIRGVERMPHGDESRRGRTAEEGVVFDDGNRKPRARGRHGSRYARGRTARHHEVVRADYWNRFALRH